MFANYIIIFCAVALIYVASLYAVYRVLRFHTKKHQLRHILIVASSALLSWFSADYLKNLIHFARPDLSKALFPLLNSASYGLPSGHAAFMFALASAMYSFDKKAGKVLYVLATLTGIARVLAGVHFWYDIVGGAVLGYAVGWLVTSLCKRLVR
jgi:membrane-associated phospholipid phosphatase